MTAPQRRRRTSRQPDPPDAGEAARKEGETQNPERLFVIGGDADGERAALDLVTLIVARADPPASATPEQAALLRLCAAPLSVAELSAYLRLPFSVVTALLTDLLAAGLVQARAPIVRQTVADRNLLEAVMHGLQKL
ncbi:DUF742 domain-containing protein [Streptomyces tagetis]|uniref:DUF742 domain-containing protein n=1 Tax=Streptomyces tagetis TaxID=2820809 RepID=A0A941B318_9ACTN|nr:DUF742 domain-containing protein [Streptomyces sp. RG38]MBQ0829796.1 DUF742 domain-containing protein [Streptomyces sp. RG38]